MIKVSDNPEDAGWTHNKLDVSKIKLNDVIEIITKTGLCIVGCVVCNKDDIIRIADPCKAEFEYISDERKKGAYFFTIKFYPWRLYGDDNFAQFKLDDISNISKVTSRKYIEHWIYTMRQFAEFWFKEGLSDIESDNSFVSN